jgi:metallo-beta-lactamase class B
MSSVSILGFAIVCVSTMLGATEAAAASSWTEPQPPAHVYGNTWYVGTRGISSVLVQTSAGLVLLDGTPEQGAPLVEASIRELGFRIGDVRLILSSHAHADHAGGIPALQRASGAEVVASASGAAALRLGHAVADDPQAGYAADWSWPALGTVREVVDGETVRVGDVTLTPHFTPGHTPGSTTWTWRSCENQRCLDVVYGDSINAVSAPGFHFLADASHPDLTPQLRNSIRTLARLPCDILISAHPDASGFDRKLRALASEPAANPFIDRDACRRYAGGFAKVLEARIAEEKAAAKR